MPLSDFDVVNLNRSLQYLGDSFSSRRREDQQRQQDMEELLLRREMNQGVAAHQKRMEDLEKARLDKDKEEIETYLTGPDGKGEIRYRGSPEGLQNFINTAKQRGTELKPSPKPGGKPPMSIKLHTQDGGEIEFGATSVDEFNQIAGEISKSHKTGKKPPELHETGDPKFPGKLTDQGHYVAPEKEDMDTVTEVTKGQEAREAIPETSSGWGPFKTTTPAQPAAPAIPEVRRTTKVPRGATPSPIGPTQLIPGAPKPDKALAAAEAKALISRQPDKANAIRARYFQTYGEPLPE